MIHDFELDGRAVRWDTAPPRRSWQISVLGLMRLVFAIACVLVMIRLFGPGVTYCDWEAARRAQCVNNLKQIGLALEGYHQQYGVLPPAYVADAVGRPMHSWRVLILPFLDQVPLYNRYNFAEPWDGPHNIRLLGDIPTVFACPSRFPAPRALTSYVAITGPGTAFPDAASVALADITDRHHSTLILAEVVDVPVPWTAPLDLDARTMSLRINDRTRPSISSRHRHGAVTAFADSHVYFWEEATPLPHDLLTIAGGDSPRGDDGRARAK